MEKLPTIRVGKKFFEGFGGFLQVRRKILGRRKAVSPHLIAPGHPEDRQVILSRQLGNGPADRLQQGSFRQVHLKYRVQVAAYPARQTHGHGQGDLGFGNGIR